LDGYEDVAEETRRLVERTAKEMNYSPNPAARKLRRKRSDTLGFIMPTPEPRYSEPFFAEFIAGLGDEANSRGFDLLTAHALLGSEDEQAIYQRWVRARKVDGFVLDRIRLQDWRVHYLASNDFPFVTLQRSAEDINQYSIEVDGRQGLMTLVQQVHKRGHRRIAYIGAQHDLVIQQERYAGYQDGLASLSLPSDPDLVTAGDLTYQGGFLAAQRLLALAQPPTAILCIDDLTAIGALDAANQLGLTVGVDLVVTGFDGIHEGLHTLPPLTTLDQSIYKLARKLAVMLIGLIAGEIPRQTNVRIIPDLVLRQSSGG
jgi:LacI family transcriptional regulator